jgi:hypothetical protein
LYYWLSPIQLNGDGVQQPGTGGCGELEAEVARLKKQNWSSSEDQYEAMLRELFSIDELTKLAIEKGLAYSLKGNEANVTGPEVVATAGEMLSITVSEAMIMSSDGFNTMLPNKILQLAMFKNLASQITVVEANAGYFESPAAVTIAWAHGFFFEKAGKGTTIKLQISETLRSRLGLNFREFTVRVN